MNKGQLKNYRLKKTTQEGPYNTSFVDPNHPFKPIGSLRLPFVFLVDHHVYHFLLSAGSLMRVSWSLMALAGTIGDWPWIAQGGLGGPREGLGGAAACVGCDKSNRCGEKWPLKVVIHRSVHIVSVSMSDRQSFDRIELSLIKVRHLQLAVQRMKRRKWLRGQNWMNNNWCPALK